MAADSASPDTPTSPTAGARRRVHGARWYGAMAVLLVAALLGGLAVIAGYVHTLVRDTDAYVATVAPLADNPDVMTAVAQRLTTEIVSGTNLTGLADDVANRLVGLGLPQRLTTLIGPLIASLESFIDSKIRQLLATPQFQTLWKDLNRVAHTNFVDVLTGHQGTLVNSSGTSVTIDLGQLLPPLKTKLADQGLTFVSAIPSVSLPYTLISSDKLPKVRRYARILNVVGVWSPYAALVLFLIGILIAPNRRRGVLTGAIMLGIFLALLLVAIAIGRRIYLDRLPPSVQSPQAAAAVWDTFLASMIAALQTLLVATVIVVLAALLAGPSRFASWLRRGSVRALDAAGRGLSHAGHGMQRVGHGVSVVRRPLEIGLLILAAVIYIVIDHPTPVSVIWLAVGLAVVLLAIEVLARASQTPVTAASSAV